MSLKSFTPLFLLNSMADASSEMIFDHEIGPYILYMDVLNNAFPLSFGSLAFSRGT